jgi:uracil-DNA glycosylase
LLGIDEGVVLWNAFPFHPHHEPDPLKNRTPDDKEITGQAVILDAFLALYPRVPIVAIGNVADRLLGELAGGRRRFKVRHPANGGVTAFGTGLDAIAVKLGIARPQPTLLD